MTAAEWNRGHDQDGFERPLPWASSLVAREALLGPSAHSRKTRPATPTLRDVSHLIRLAEDLAIPPLDGTDAEQILHDFALRTVYQQWPYATASAFGNLARLLPMLDRTFPVDRFKVLSTGTLHTLPGGPLEVFINSAPFFGAAASRNNGLFNEAWLSGPQFDEVRPHMGFLNLLSVFRTAWASDLRDARRQAQNAGTTTTPMAQFDWNPLQARPFVRLTSGDYVAPQVRFAQQRIGTSAIYHLGIEAHGPVWAHDLGLAQEDYIVTQLEQLQPFAAVIPEVEWPTKHGDVRSVDAIVVLPDCIALFESKSLRTRRDSSSDFAAYVDRLTRTDLAKALETQIPRTIAAIRGRNPALAAVPDDGRPVVAFVVTPERLYLANVPGQRKHFPDPLGPRAVAVHTNPAPTATVPGMDRREPVADDDPLTGHPPTT